MIKLFVTRWGGKKLEIVCKTAETAIFHPLEYIGSQEVLLGRLEVNPGTLCNEIPKTSEFFSAEFLFHHSFRFNGYWRSAAQKSTS